MCRILGLSLTYPKRPPLVLVYLFWEPRNADNFEVFARHRSEVEHFASLVRGDESFKFLALSYIEHWAELDRADSATEWLPTLRDRYDVAI
jgi:hypothetical protein